MAKSQLTIDCAGFSPALHRTVLQLARKMLPLLPLAQLRWLTIAAVSDVAMKSMNTRYRHKAKTTDVLSFQYPPDGAELYVSLTVAKRQARARKITLANECQRLLVHGLCHLAGHDHHTLPEFMTMRQTEFEVFIQCANVSS